MSLFITAAVLICAVKANAEHTENKPMISNVSHTEYESKMKEFLGAVKSTIQETTHIVVLPKGAENQGTGNEVIRFSSKDIPRGNGHSFRMFISDTTKASIYQVDTSGKETQIGTESFEKGPRWVGVNVGKHSTEELAFRIKCGSGCKVLHPMLNVFIAMQSGERGILTDSYKCHFNVSDDNAHCCLRQKDINLREMNLKKTLEGPAWVTFGYCVGACPFNFNYATEHARLRHLVERIKRISRKSQDPCLPTKYGSIKVLEQDMDDSLAVKTWDNFYATSCACF